MTPNEIGIIAITNPFPSRSEKPSKTADKTEIAEKI
jgi:hypothetical protein